ncbi:FdhF/YdeP family oxidoreductase [Methylopila turkensis]|uniref:Molybdopterin oxidoreductase alpha subunit n=1 Tax=Methylopila turkensis TaxID=1437816 RepID=A0A9W6JMM0_9HYPH|nr:FdhF/YdeP family oxidoreductase [Methylopila turkensis]GLK78959.1 molybdopterin oxidoreductase alpha subunit [Methylopila turkensis]
MARDGRIETYDGPAGGWGSAKSVGRALVYDGAPLKSGAALWKQNKPGGFACVSCAWSKPREPHLFEFCENGAKATGWELTSKTIGAEFFARHTLTELEGWSDFELEDQGRLTEPLKYDAASDTYQPIAWERAFEEIGGALKATDPKRTAFYASGRASLETSYMYQLLARAYGANNLPDSSNMCHESTSVALPESIGVPVGTVFLDDFDHADLIFFFGQNVGSNAPRMLHPLQEAAKRGVPIITFNPLKERGLERFTNPQAPTEMLSGAETRISTQYHQVKAGGDLAALFGLCKALIAIDDAAAPGAKVIDHAFIAEHCHGYDAFADACRARDWPELERCSGLTRHAIEIAAEVYSRSSAAIGVYGMGLTQHRSGVDNVQMLMNLLLMKGNIGRPGAGICPVRGHSNVQGQRTVGITEKASLAPLDRLKELYGFEPPREDGMATVDVCEGIIDGEVEAFVSLGGNFLRATPETGLMEDGWRKLKLSVQIATKLNRSHVVHGRAAYLLPCLGRIEIDRQAGRPQIVSIEDSTSHFHASHGFAEPCAPTLLSEPAIVAGIAKATLPPNPSIDWDGWTADYARVRDAIEATYPKVFPRFNERIETPGGFPKPISAREREWNTSTGKANFIFPESLDENPDMPAPQPDALRLITLRSNDQFNTTVYGYDDRFRGVEGTRMVVFMHANDIARLSLRDGQTVAMRTVADDFEREVEGFRIVAYDIPEGCVGAYYPECNPLIPLWHHARGSKVPAAKSVPVLIRPCG